jgi:hypothetical protein
VRREGYSLPFREQRAARTQQRRRPRLAVPSAPLNGAALPRSASLLRPRDLSRFPLRERDSTLRKLPGRRTSNAGRRSRVGLHRARLHLLAPESTGVHFCRSSVGLLPSLGGCHLPPMVGRPSSNNTWAGDRLDRFPTWLLPERELSAGYKGGVTSSTACSGRGGPSTPFSS